MQTDDATLGDRIERPFSGQRAAAYSLPDDVDSQESQAALRQLSVERLMAYGVHHPDALELRGRVWSGEAWQAVATDLAESCLAPPEAQVSPPSGATRANRLYRAAALLRMSQMMMLQNSAERSAIYGRATDLYVQAAELTGDRRRELFETPHGVLRGWLYPSTAGATVGQVFTVGGVEGWAQDFSEMGLALAARGIETLVLDGPGQGESRLLHGHYLTPAWEASYGPVIEAMAARNPRLPIGVVGNSMGGSVAMHLAARNPLIKVCCDNGGTSAPPLARANATFFQKMTAHVGDVSGDEAQAVWATVQPANPDHPVRCPLLVVHGAADPLISSFDAQNLFNNAASEDKTMVVFSDGDHCIYNHTDDKMAVIGDWLADRLRRTKAS